VLRRFAKTGAATARGRYAALRPVRDAQEAIAPEPITSADAYEAATVSTATTLEWLMNLWEANSSMEDSGGLDDSFDTQQNHYYPQP
jgi:hypothetical protein